MEVNTHLDPINNTLICPFLSGSPLGKELCFEVTEVSTEVSDKSLIKSLRTPAHRQNTRSHIACLDWLIVGCDYVQSNQLQSMVDQMAGILLHSSLCTVELITIGKSTLIEDFFGGDFRVLLTLLQCV